MMKRFYVADRAKSQDLDLARSRAYFERWMVVDRQTGRIVADAANRYEARQDADLYNSGILTTGSES